MLVPNVRGFVSPACGPVKKEKVLELAAETFSSSEITPLLEKTTDESQVKGADQNLGKYFFMGFLVLMFLGVGLLNYRVIRSAARRRLRRGNFPISLLLNK